MRLDSKSLSIKEVSGSRRAIRFSMKCVGDIGNADKTGVLYRDDDVREEQK